MDRVYERKLKHLNGSMVATVREQAAVDWCRWEDTHVAVLSGGSVTGLDVTYQKMRPGMIHRSNRSTTTIQFGSRLTVSIPSIRPGVVCVTVTPVIGSICDKRAWASAAAREVKRSEAAGGATCGITV